MLKRYLAAPFVILPLAARLFVGPIGDSLARAATRVAPPAFVTDAPNLVDEPAPIERRSEHGRSAHVAASPSTRARVALDAGAPRTLLSDAGSQGPIVVPPATVARAIADKRIGARDALDENGAPIGARIHGVNRYGSGLQNGDIIVSVGGTPTPTTGALVEIAMRMVSGGATKLTGKIRRGDQLFDVVLELPPRTG